MVRDFFFFFFHSSVNGNNDSPLGITTIKSLGLTSVKNAIICWDLKFRVLNVIERRCKQRKDLFIY